MAGRAPCQTTSIGLAGLESDIARLRLSVSGPAPGFGLPKPVTILVAHLLLNIKKHHKNPIFFFFMQNKCSLCFQLALH